MIEIEKGYKALLSFTQSILSIAPVWTHNLVEPISFRFCKRKPSETKRLQKGVYTIDCWLNTRRIPLKRLNITLLLALLVRLDVDFLLEILYCLIEIRLVVLKNRQSRALSPHQANSATPVQSVQFSLRCKI